METKQTNPQQLESELNQFTGDILRWRNALNPRVLYTPGVRHLIDRAGAYWLVDMVASHLVPEVLKPAAKKDARIRALHFWKLEVHKDHSALLFAEADYGVTPFVTQEIDHTDFPLREVVIWAGFDGEHWVLYLPSEH